MNNSLKNYLLLTMPEDDNKGIFHRAITLLCKHDKDGTFGLVLNKELDIVLSKMLKLAKITTNESFKDVIVYNGGPVSTDQGFVLHSPIGDWKHSIIINDNTAITLSMDILEAIGQGNPPQDYQVFLGCAVWDIGQLEQEIKLNYWLETPFDKRIVYAGNKSHLWQQTYSSLGINLNRLSDLTGNA